MKGLSSMKKTQAINESCVAKTTSIFGDKWTPLLISCLSDKSLRFCQLQQAAGGINPRTLSARLTFLESEGIIKKILFAEIPPHSEYSLTTKGKDLLPILYSMVVWGDKYKNNQ